MIIVITPAINVTGNISILTPTPMMYHPKPNQPFNNFFIYNSSSIFSSIIGEVLTATYLLMVPNTPLSNLSSERLFNHNKASSI